MENLNLIRKIAWSFHHSTGIDYTELFSEASLAYCEALLSYDFRKSNDSVFTTFAWKVMETQLINFATNERVKARNIITTISNLTEGHLEISESTIFQKSVSYQPESFSEFFDSLPIECKLIATYVIDHIDEISDTIPPKIARGKVVEILRREGWSWDRIWKGIHQMKLVLS